MKRETGYYWVKYYGDWYIAYWQANHNGFFVWYDDSAEESHLQEINETRIKNPNENGK